MTACGNNATPPSPAIAPGVEGIEARAVAARIGAEGVDPRLLELVPGFDAPFFQAGLAGYSDAAMRIVARRQGCPFCVTEALLDRTLLSGGRGFAKADLGEVRDNVPGGEEDQPLCGQIMGSDPREMAAAALKMMEQGARPVKEYRGMVGNGKGIFNTEGTEGGGDTENAEGKGRVGDGERVRLVSSVPSFSSIDLNFACPVKKIKNKARGGHWLMAPEGAIAIMEAVREVVPAEVPVSIKVRRAFDDSVEMAENFDRVLSAAFDIGIAWATVHGRTVEQKYLGPSRWDLLRDIVARYPDRLIFGSGDVWKAEDIFTMIEYTGVKAVSVARGCIGNPWIFRQARDLMSGQQVLPPTIAQQRAVLEEHFALAMAVNGWRRNCEQYTGRTMRKFAIKFAQHHPRGDEVKRGFVGVKSLSDWGGVLDEFYQVEGDGAGHVS